MLLSPRGAGGLGWVLGAGFAGVDLIPRGGDQAGEFVLLLEIGDVLNLPFADGFIESDGIGIHVENILKRGRMREGECGDEPKLIALLEHVGPDDGDRAGHAGAELEFARGAGAFPHSGFAEGFVVGF